MKIETFPTREAWLEARRSSIGGSDVSAILGLSSFATPLTVWAIKVGIELPAATDLRLNLGTRLEPVIAQLLSEEADVSVKRHELAIVRHATIPWLSCSLDGEAGDDAIVELKAVDSSKAEDWDNGVPPYYMPQIQHNLYVTGRSLAYVAALIGGTRDFRWCKVVADTAAYEADVLPLLRDFWALVVSETPPPPSGDDGDKAALGRMYPNPTDETKPLDPAFLEDAQTLAEIDATVEACEARRDLIQNNIRAALGTAGRGILPDGTGWTWSKQTRPKMVADPTQPPSEFRVLRRFGVKKEKK